MNRVGRFELLRELGRGGFGVVYEGVDPASGTPVAVKVLEGLGLGSAGRSQLLGEAAALEEVVSPFTLRVLDVVDADGVLALVTDLVPGVTLRRILDTYGRLSGPDALRVLWGAGQGLAAVRGPTPVAVKAADPNSFGSVIGFSASPGEPALDGAPGENSPYAAALLKHFAAGGYSFGDVMTMVTEEVYLKTRAKQLPWTNSSLRRVLSFDAPAEEDTDPDQSAIRSERRKLLLTVTDAAPELQPLQ